MPIKKCPECGRYTVSFNFHRGVEMCHVRDCNWVNADNRDLPVAHDTILTSKKEQTNLTSEGVSIAKAAS